MTQSEQQPGHLPRLAVDHGDRIEVRPSTGTRLGGVVGGVAAVAAGIAVVVIEPGDLGGEPLARFGIGGAMVVAGLVTLLTTARRLDVGADGLSQRTPVGSRSLPWSDVTELHVEKAAPHRSSGPGRSSRRVGGGTLSVGTGTPSSTSIGPFRRYRRTVALRVRSDERRDLALDLGGVSLDEGAALVGAVQARGWVPDDVDVHVDAHR